MPTRFNSICTYPGCNRLTKNIRCENHRYSHVDERKSSRERGYDNHWTRLRNAYIRDNPVCEIREKCNGDAAAEVDHIIPIAQGGERLDQDNLQSTCKRCHSWKTHHVDNAWPRASEL